VLFVFGDHGEGLGEHDRFGHNQTLYAEETHVPLVVSGPGIVPMIEPSPVSLTEVPTLALGALGLVYPHGARGGRDAPHGRAGFVLLEYKMLDQVTQRALRSSSLAFVHWYLEDTVEIFDLALDPTDRTLARPDASRQREMRSLERAIEDWQSREIARIEALPRVD
jgi:arylsulfatase A-like enzyme